MYNEITLKEKENLYLRKQSKCTKRGIILITKVKLQRFKKFKNNEIVLKPFT